MQIDLCASSRTTISSVAMSHNEPIADVDGISCATNRRELADLPCQSYPSSFASCAKPIKLSKVWLVEALRRQLITGNNGNAKTSAQLAAIENEDVARRVWLALRASRQMDRCAQLSSPVTSASRCYRSLCVLLVMNDLTNRLIETVEHSHHL